MTRPKPIVLVGLVVLAGAIGWLVFAGLPRLYSPRTVDEGRAAVQPAGAERRINATLFFVSEDGLALIGAQREIPFGEAIAEQARRIVEAQLAAAPAPLASA